MGLVTTKEMFAKAYKSGYAIGAFNINNMEEIEAVVGAAKEMKTPVILQASAFTLKYTNIANIVQLAKIAADDAGVSVALNLDHGESFDLCKDFIHYGFTSVMIDGSRFSFEENINLTKQVCKYAHDRGVVVEGELGKLAGIEDNVRGEEDTALYTDPLQAKEFVERTGVDSLAIAIGTSHGAYKFKLGQKPYLRFDILEEVQKLMQGFPIVLHGASSVIPKYVEMINTYGGIIQDARGIPVDMLRKATSMAVCKVNIDSDIRLTMTGTIRQYLHDNPKHFDPRQYLGYARDCIKAMVIDKMNNVLGYDGMDVEILQKTAN